MREIVLDTETTGFDPATGDRIVEIGCVELIDHLPTGKSFQAYLNPERLVPIETQKVHGLTDEFLAEIIAKARDRGELPRSADPHALAQLASGTLHTLAVRARAGVPRKELDALAAVTVSTICGPEH